MKALKRALPILLIALAAFVATGCKPEEARTQDECMQEFADAVNSESWGDIKDCTSSDATLHNIAPDTLWETYFGIGSGTFTFDVSGDTATGTKDGVDFSFTLVEDEKDYYAISAIYAESERIFY